MSAKELQVTSLEQLKQYAKGDIVELPPFAQNRPFIARLSRPSLMKLVEQGRIPNTLLSKANELFSTGIAGAFDEENKDALKQLFELMEIICEASFVEPTYQDIKDAGLELTDEQRMFVYNYGQAGVRALESFRGESDGSESSGSSAVLSNETKSTTGNR